MLRFLPLLLLLVIVAAATVLRIYPAYADVLGSGEVNFLETDASYHVRLVEHQVRNYPWRVTLDPYALAGGQFVPIAPFYDTLTATAVLLLHGPQASEAAIEQVAAYGPPILGALAIVAAWALSAHLFGSRAGLCTAALLATMPGHFLDRTMLGFVDHHALEALLAVATLLALARATTPTSPAQRTARDVVFGGIALGLYLLTWASGAFLVAILGLWLLVVVVQVRSAEESGRVARQLVAVALIALAMVLAFQDPQMYRYGTQIVGLGGLVAMALAVASTPRLRLPSMPVALGGVALIVVIGTLGVWWSAPQLFQQVTSDLRRLTPDPSRMAVREARPMFLYSGKWEWSQPWHLLGSSVYIGAIALLPLARVAWQSRRPGDALVWVFGVSTLAATIAQNRFAYYLVPALAILIGWLADEVLTRGGWTRQRSAAAREASVPLQREVALAAAAAMLLAPMLTAAKLVGERRTGASQQWLDTAFWLRQHTPPPFSSNGGDAYYFARYGSRVAEPDYTIMTWWDYGYLITQRARRVPVSNPTQANAGISARFYVETDEPRAVAILREQRARFVLADYEQPFRYSTDGRIMGQLQSILDWAGATHDDYYRVCFRRTEGGWTPLWMFREAYYRSMAFRLAIAGGAAMEPRKVSVVTLADRTDSHGVPFCEVQNEKAFPSYEAAQQFVASVVIGKPIIVGLEPQQSPFPIEALSSLERIQNIFVAGQPPSTIPPIRVFRLKESAPSP